MAAGKALPTARVTLTGAKSMRRGNPWLYRTELAEPPSVKTHGTVVAVVDPQGNPIGQAFYAQRSPLALRLLTRRPATEEPVDDAFFRRRLEAALARRAPLKHRDGLRLVHGEADL